MKILKVENQNLLTTTEVAQYLKINKNTVYHLARSGKVPAIKVGKQWRFNREQLDAWMQGGSSNNV